MKTFILFTLVMGISAKWFTPAAPIQDGCNKNEQRVACAYDCEPQCGFSPTVCSYECTPNKCVCRDGFVRNTNGDCVHRLECTPETSRCPEDEEFQTCGALCQPSCEDPYPTSCPHDTCVRNVCRCLPGFVRNGPVCTPLSDCHYAPARPLELFTLSEESEVAKSEQITLNVLFGVRSRKLKHLKDFLVGLGVHIKMFLFIFVHILMIITTVISDSQEEPSNNPCKNYQCHPFTECHLVKRQEDNGTLVPEPVCIKVPSCATKKCDYGEKCAMKPVKCQLTPCFKIPTCLPDVNEASPEYQMPPALLV